jgi:hypothetical protein
VCTTTKQSKQAHVLYNDAGVRSHGLHLDVHSCVHSCVLMNIRNGGGARMMKGLEECWHQRDFAALPDVRDDALHRAPHHLQ